MDNGSSLWTILYVADGRIYNVALATEDLAMQWAKKHDMQNVPDDKPELSEFDSRDQYIYLLSPDHSMVELSSDDLKAQIRRRRGRRGS